MQAVASHKLHEVYTGFADAAGQGGVLRLCVAGDTKVIATTPAAFAAVLRGRPFQPKPAGIYNVFSMFGVKGPSLMTTPCSDEHTRIRQHFMRFFNAENVSKTVARLAEQMGSSTSVITAAHNRGAIPPRSQEHDDGVQVDDATAEGVLVDPFTFAAFNVLRVVFNVFLEVDMMPPLKEFNSVMSHANTVSAHPAQFALLKRGLYPGYRKFRHNFDVLYKFHCDLVDAMFDKPAPGDSTAFWAALRNAFPDAMTDKAQHEGAVSNASFIYAAGYETTANAVSHTLAALAIDQDSQAALAEELHDAGLLATPERPDPPTVTAEQLASFSVLEAVCHESLRVFPPLPNGGFRELTHDTEICGYMVPKGTPVMFAVWALHHNKHVWGEDALTWRPDRWLEGKSVAAAKKDAAGQLRFLPFLDGPSNCIGQNLALVEMKLMVACVVSRLHVTLDPDRMVHIHSVDDYMADLITTLTLKSARPTWLRMRPRSSSL